MADGVSCAQAGPIVPNGYYHLGRMLTGTAHHGGKTGCCGTCLDARHPRRDAGRCHGSPRRFTISAAPTKMATAPELRTGPRALTGVGPRALSGPA